MTDRKMYKIVMEMRESQAMRNRALSHGNTGNLLKQTNIFSLTRAQIKNTGPKIRPREKKKNKKFAFLPSIVIGSFISFKSCFHKIQH